MGKTEVQQVVPKLTKIWTMFDFGKFQQHLTTLYQKYALLNFSIAELTNSTNHTDHKSTSVEQAEQVWCQSNSTSSSNHDDRWVSKQQELFLLCYPVFVVLCAELGMLLSGLSSPFDTPKALCIASSKQ
jgi:hypothetical protein